MVVPMFSVDSMINAYNKQHRAKAGDTVSADLKGDSKGSPDDEVNLPKPGIEAADIYNKAVNKLIDNMLKEDKK